MAYDEKLAERIREALQDEEGVIEKKMFGGLCFMMRGRMFCGIVKDDLMVRCLPERYEELLEKPGAREMDFTGKPMKGFLYVESEELKTSRQLKWWIEAGVEFVMKPQLKKKKKR